MFVVVVVVDFLFYLFIYLLLLLLLFYFLKVYNVLWSFIWLYPCVCSHSFGPCLVDV